MPWELLHTNIPTCVTNHKDRQPRSKGLLSTWRRERTLGTKLREQMIVHVPDVTGGSTNDLNLFWRYRCYLEQADERVEVFVQGSNQWRQNKREWFKFHLILEFHP